MAFLRLWKQALAYAVCLWLASFLLLLLLSLATAESGRMIATVVLLLATVLLSWLCASRLRFVALAQGLGVGLVWAGMSVLLDELLLVSGLLQGNLDFFRLAIAWGRYLILFFVPVILSLRRYSST